MNHCVPDYFVPTTNIARPNQSGQNEMTDQFWHNIHLLDQYSYTKPPSSKSMDTAAANNPLYTADDQMAAWLDYPLHQFYTEPSHPNPGSATPPPPQTTFIQPENSGREGFGFGFPQLSRILGPLERRRSEFTAVESNDTRITRGGMSTVGPTVAASTSPVVVAGDGERLEAGEELTTSQSSSSAGTDTNIDAQVRVGRKKSKTVCRKRKIEGIDESFVATTVAALSRTLDLESDDEKKHSHGSRATKRTRAADVHNLSERRRRDRINEKMKALQELIPRCNKSDKASLLDETVEYVKSLQTQIQMMSMGYGMMYAGMQQQYALLMGKCMGMGTGTDMGMSHQVMAMPYPPAIPGPAAAVPSPGTNVALPLAPRIPIPPYALPCVQPSTPADSTGNQYAVQIPGMTQTENMAKPSRPFLTNRCKCRQYR